MEQDFQHPDDLSKEEEGEGANLDEVIHTVRVIDL